MNGRDHRHISRPRERRHYHRPAGLFPSVITVDYRRIASSTRMPPMREVLRIRPLDPIGLILRRPAPPSLTHAGLAWF